MTANIECFIDQLPMVTGHVQNQIMLIRKNNVTGTCFFASIPRGQCWITARHVVEGLKSGDTVDFYHDGVWKSFRTLEVKHSSQEQDISAFTSELAISADTRIDLANQMGVFQAQTLLVFGYPHGIIQQGITGDPFTIPLCKRGCFSGAIDIGQAKFMVMDAIINPGFSGAPVFASDLTSKKRVFVGVVSHFRPESDQLASVWDHSSQPPKLQPHLKVNLHSGLTCLVPTKNARQIAEELTNLTPQKTKQ